MWLTQAVHTTHSN